MSIINDALKKVQYDLNQKTKQVKILPEKRNPSLIEKAYYKQSEQLESKIVESAHMGSPKKEVKLLSKILLISFCVTTVLFFFLFQYQYKQISFSGSLSALPIPVSSLVKTKAIKIKPIKEIESFQKPNTFKTAPDSVPSKKMSEQSVAQTSPLIEIKGIMVMDDKNVVLIGDQIFEAGDLVNETTILKISLDGIEVEKGGNITFVKAKK